MSDKLSGGIKPGAVDVSLPVVLRNAADNTGKTGVAHGSVTAYYWRQGGTPTNVAMAALSNIDDAHSDGGWKEADATNQKGAYRIDWPDAAFAAGADWVVLSITVTDAYVWHLVIPLETERGRQTDTAAVKAQTDLMSFTDGDIHATLDGEEVTVDASNLATFTNVTPDANGDFTSTIGDDYTAANGRPFLWNEPTSGAWPDLTGATVVIVARNALDVELLNVAMDVTHATGNIKQVRLELADSDTSGVSPNTYNFDIEATLSGGDVVTLVQGEWTAKQEYSR